MCVHVVMCVCGWVGGTCVYVVGWVVHVCECGWVGGTCVCMWLGVYVVG